MKKNCTNCQKEFLAHHFNSKVCSDACRLDARKKSKNAYKKTDKGIASRKRWQSSDRFKENEKMYRQKPRAKRKLLEAQGRYLMLNSEARERRRRASSLHQKKKHSLKEWWTKISSYGCKNCGVSEDLTIDHIIPMSKGGSDNIANLQCLCRSCNSVKGDKIVKEVI
jgi:5-methylcytosine-specific restriction endonuclease McrA